MLAEKPDRPKNPNRKSWKMKVSEHGEHKTAVHLNKSEIVTNIVSEFPYLSLEVKVKSVEIDLEDIFNTFGFPPSMTYMRVALGDLLQYAECKNDGERLELLERATERLLCLKHVLAAEDSLRKLRSKTSSDTANVASHSHQPSPQSSADQTKASPPSSGRSNGSPSIGQPVPGLFAGDNPLLKSLSFSAIVENGELAGIEIRIPRPKQV